MPTSMQIVSIEIKGSTDYAENMDRLAQRAEHDDGLPSLIKERAEVIQLLNKDASDMSAEIVKEVRNALPPNADLTVQAEIRFSDGSIIMAGTVIILSWAGNIVLEEIKGQLAQVVKAATNRVAGQIINRNYWYLRPVNAIAEPIQESAKEDVAQKTVQPDVSPAQDQNKGKVLASDRSVMTSLHWAVLVLAVFVALLLLDRIFEVKLRSNAPPHQANVESPDYRRYAPYSADDYRNPAVPSPDYREYRSNQDTRPLR